MKKIKRKITAMGLAVLMGLSSVGSMTYAHEDKETDITAEDITKSVNDASFTAETCMEGIHFDASKETVTLESVESEKGGSYQPKQAGTYIARYRVVPKDQRDSYVISRKIVLTDTEGSAHAEDNGGRKQKEDTDPEDHSEPESKTMPEVSVTSTNESDTKKTLEQLEEDIENGNIMILSAADLSLSRAARSAVHLEKGEDIQYPSYLGNYLTCKFRVNGKIAYCLQSHKATPPSGEYVAKVLDSNENLQKVLYYGYGGAGDITGSYLSGKSANERYVYTHIAASYAYAGENGFAGCAYNDLVGAGVIAYINHLFGMEKPPKGELSLSKTDVKAVRNGELQKTSNIKLNGDHRNYITVTVPKDVTCHNLTKETSATNGKLRIYGGDTFYLSALMSVTGKYASGNLYGSIRETWKTLVLTTGNEQQDIGVFESESASPVSFKVDWLEMARIELVKKDMDTKNPLAGAVYGIYTDKKCENLFLTMTATGAGGKAVSDYFDAALKCVYVREITAPKNYVRNPDIYKVDVEAGKTAAVTGYDERVTGSVHIHKTDRETEKFLPQGDSALSGAVYGLYAKEDIVHPDGKTGVLFRKGSLITQGVIKKDGSLDFTELYLGKMYVKEITPPKGYTLDMAQYDVTVTYEGQEQAEVTRDLTVSEQVKKQAFQLIKISEDGEQTEADLVKGAGFTVYLVSSLSKVKSGELAPANGSAFVADDFRNYDFSGEKAAVTYEKGKEVLVPELMTDAKGYAVSPELPYGLYVVEESTVPKNLKKIAPFLVTVEEDSREPMQWRIFDDRPFQFLLKIMKKDAQTGSPVLKAGASYKIFDCEKEEYVEQVIQYPKKEKISVFTTNDEGCLVTPEKLKCSTYRIEETAAPEGFVRQGNEMSLYDGENLLSAAEITTAGEYKENPQKSIEITISSDTAHQIDPDTGAVIVGVEQSNDEQVGSLTLTKTGEQLIDVSGKSILEQAASVFGRIKDVITGTDSDMGVFRKFEYEELGVEGAEFELYAKDTIYSPDYRKDEKGDPVVRFEKDDLVAKLTTDGEGKAVVHNLPLGSYYLKETKAGEHFVLNTEQKAFTLTAGNDTQAVVYESVSYKNERQKVKVTADKKDSVSGKPLEGVVFGLYAGEDIVSLKGDVLVEKDTLLEKKESDAEGRVQFDSDLYHGKYYVKELRKLPGYLTNETVWEFEAVYENQEVNTLTFQREIENQPTETHFSKTDATTGEELEGAKLQIIGKDKHVVEEWVSKKEPHIVYGLPEGSYTLHEELAPFENGYVSAADAAFEVREDGSVTKVEMKDEYSKVDISKTDLTTGKELPGATLQVIGRAGEILEEWVTDGKPHRIEKLPVGEELILRELSAPEGYEIAEEVKFTLEDTMEIRKVEMKDAKIPDIPVPKTGDNRAVPMILLAVCTVSAAAFAVVTIRRKKKNQHEEK